MIRPLLAGFEVTGDSIWFETDRSISFLDGFPVSEGHALIIPKTHVASIFELPANKLDDMWRLAVRSHQSRPIVKPLERVFLRLKRSGRFLPQSLLGLAIDYALSQWPTLNFYFADGKVEIDNNLM